jgi:hypothetical protein
VILTAQQRRIFPAGSQQPAGLFFGLDPFMRNTVLQAYCM